MKPLVLQEKSVGIFLPIIGTYQGKKIHGFTSQDLVSFCNMMIEADQAGLLRMKRQKIVAAQAHTLKNVFSKVGLDALIDEATGYQEMREKDELQALLEKYVCEEFRPWSRQFPEVFYEQICRLNRWNYMKNMNGPRVVALWTNTLIYRKNQKPIGRIK